MNAGGVAKTCKSDANVLFGELLEWRKGEEYTGNVPLAQG